VVTGALGAAAVGLLGYGFARTTNPAAATVVTGVLQSRARRADSGWVVVYPPGIDPTRPVLPAGGRVPVVVALHGYGSDQTVLQRLGLDVALGAATAAGAAPFALAAIAGGDTYWHPRRDGTDAAAMVTEEFLPALAEHGLAAGPQYQVGLLGWSMGGYGALRLAELLGPGRVRAVAAASPALWRAPGDTPAGAFDDAEDYHHNDVFAHRSALKGISVRIDCGLGDPFLVATRSFVSGVQPPPAGGFGPGGHDDAYWATLAVPQIAFLGSALAGTSLHPNPSPSAQPSST